MVQSEEVLVQFRKCGGGVEISQTGQNSRASSRELEGSAEDAHSSPGSDTAALHAPALPARVQPKDSGQALRPGRQEV